MKMYQKIKNCKSKKMSIRQAARKLELSRKTVSKYYKMDDKKYIEYLLSKETKDKKFDEYRDEILELYEKNENKVYKSSIYDVLEEKYGKLPGSERTLRNYIQFLKKEGKLQENLPVRFYIPVSELPFGKQMQVDFGEIEINSGEKVYIFASVLSASRFRYVAVQRRPFKTVDVIQHLLECFDYIEGIPKEIVIDQDKTMIVSENQGDILLTKEFQSFTAEMGYSLYVCRKADPETKGKVENLVKFVKTSFFSGRVFNSFDEIPSKLDSWLTRRANGKICQATGLVPSNLIGEERKKLHSVRLSIYKKDNIIEREERRVNEKCLISVKASLYSVPIEYRSRKVWIFHTESELFIYDAPDGKEVTSHRLSLLPGQQIIKKNHFRNFKGKPSEMKTELISRLDSPLWETFIEKNYKKFKRYFRDQHKALSNYLNTKLDEKILEKALQFCLDTGTYSANNLKEAYLYIAGIEYDLKPDILPVLIKGIRDVKNDSKNLKVEKRKLSYYTSLVSFLGGAL